MVRLLTFNETVETIENPFSNKRTKRRHVLLSALESVVNKLEEQDPEELFRERKPDYLSDEALKSIFDKRGKQLVFIDGVTFETLRRIAEDYVEVDYDLVVQESMDRETLIQRGAKRVGVKKIVEGITRVSGNVSDAFSLRHASVDGFPVMNGGATWILDYQATPEYRDLMERFLPHMSSHFGAEISFEDVDSWNARYTIGWLRNLPRLVSGESAGLGEVSEISHHGPRTRFQIEFPHLKPATLSGRVFLFFRDLYHDIAVYSPSGVERDANIELRERVLDHANSSRRAKEAYSIAKAGVENLVYRIDQLRSAGIALDEGLEDDISSLDVNVNEIERLSEPVPTLRVRGVERIESLVDDVTRRRADLEERAARLEEINESLESTSQRTFDFLKKALSLEGEEGTFYRMKLHVGARSKMPQPGHDGAVFDYATLLLKTMQDPDNHHLISDSDLTYLTNRGLLELPEWIVGTAAYEHDDGKALISPEIVGNPGKLSYLEYNEMKRHVDYGVLMAEASNRDRRIIEGIRDHHENWDGTGYHGVESYDISFVAWFLIFGDRWDVMTGPMRARSYERNLKTVDEAFEDVTGNAGSQFPPLIVPFVEKMLPELRELYKERNKK